MLPGALPRGSETPAPASSPAWWLCPAASGLRQAVSPPGGGALLPTPWGQSVRARKGRGRNASVLGAGRLPEHEPSPPCLLWQIHRCRNPGGLGRWVQGSAVRRARAGNTKLKSSPLAQCPCGAGVLPTSPLRRHTSYQSGGCAGRESWRRPCPESA